MRYTARGHARGHYAPPGQLYIDWNLRWTSGKEMVFDSEHCGEDHKPIQSVMDLGHSSVYMLDVYWEGGTSSGWRNNRLVELSPSVVPKVMCRVDEAGFYAPCRPFLGYTLYEWSFAMGNISSWRSVLVDQIIIISDCNELVINLINVNPVDM